MEVMYGAFIRKVRLSRGFTQQELADVSGIPQANVSAYETGRRIPSAETLNRLVVACGLELAATDGRTLTIFCDLPRRGWFPDEDAPPADPSDPPEEAPVLSPDTTPEERAAALLAVLEAVEAVRGPQL